LLRLIDFIEGRFNIQVEAYEAGVDNFDRIQDIASFIQKKQNPGA
jgi:acyl carrier protein